MNEYVLEIKGLNKSYGKKTALTDINLELERGKIVGLLGPNGSGKTTLIKLINGLLTANSGIITVDGNPIGEKSRLSVSYLPDKTYLPDWMKVKDVMKMFEDFYENFDIKKAEDMLGKLLDAFGELESTAESLDAHVRSAVAAGQYATQVAEGLLEDKAGGLFKGEK